ncbi:MAG: hypothetical protein WC500_06420 [Candidatus Margulisiibacteriota bacterium]
MDNIIAIFIGAFGGLIVAIFQYIMKQKSETEAKIQSLNENKYRSTLVFMRCVLVPENLKQFDISDPNIHNLRGDELQKYVKAKLVEYYYNSFLYASDDVLRNLKMFIETPSEDKFEETARAMRKDLWKK